ncbi:MAG: hypothetical protein JSV79_01295 [Armatimonadota bacterium]|nr:MAG: hypothetical protein JSV79_01295 [Armatimonadota bacterium]
MIRSSALTLLSVTLMAVTAFTQGCGGNSAIELGSKPAIYSGERADQSQLVDDMRAWLKTLGPEETKSLQETGRIVFPYEELRKSDPVRAQMIETYRKEAEARVAERMKARGELAPIFTVESVSFVRLERDARGRPIRGVYEFRINLADGGILSNPQLSDPL